MKKLLSLKNMTFEPGKSCLKTVLDLSKLDIKTF